MPIAVLMMLDETEALHFVRCSKEGLLSGNTSKQLIVMNLAFNS